MDIAAPASQRSPLDWRIVMTSIVGFWVFYTLVVTLRAEIMEFPAPAELAVRRLAVSGAGVVLTILYWLALRALDNFTLRWRAVAAVILAIPLSVAIASANYYAFNIYDPVSLVDVEEKLPKELRASALQEIADAAIGRYFFLIAWASFYLALSFAKDVGSAERKAAVFAQAAQTAELRALRYQVNPHFLFNTLNSLSALVMKGEKALADAMIMNLSTFYRTSLAGEPSEDVPLSEEIELQKLYLEIEAVRFPKRLTVSIHIEDGLDDVAVPGLILQPLVENAIKHGVSQTNAPVMLTISARADGETLILSVADSAGGGRPGNSGGIGLANVRDRLAARFGGRASLEHGQEANGGYRATIRMPLARARA